MAGLILTVCLPPEARADPDAALARVMDPFHIDCGVWERAMWDSWSLRVSSNLGRFRVLPGYEGDPRLIHEAPDDDGRMPPGGAGWCAGGPRGLLDFDGPRAAERAWAGSAWDLWQRLAARHPPYLPFSVFQERHAAVIVHSPPWARACADYEAQPLLRAAAAYPEADAPVRFAERVDALGRPDVYFAGTREEFAGKVGDDAVLLTDLLTSDGWWIEADGTAMHATCEAATTCEHRSELLDRPADNRTHMESLPDDTLLVRVRCHV
ncbi:hypothetical protein ACIRL2_45140 [Embleya sp. NPDC127516]|uniref:hypothetical protein n=1 Tax=Embleya sp. NPDC127516 TaxID=3363990 RepID=UPI003811C46A